MVKASEPLDGEISVDGQVDLTGAREFLRFWIGGDQGKPTCFIDPYALGPDPFLFGMALVDAVRHAAKAYSGVVDISESDAQQRIWAGLDAEREKPTDKVVQIQGAG